MEQWIFSEGAKHGLDPKRVAIAGDSAGGNMVIAVILMRKNRGDVKFRGAALFYPVTAGTLFDTESYNSSRVLRG